MANTTTINPPHITVVFDGSTDWDLNDDAFEQYPHFRKKGLRIVNLQMVPNAHDDAIVIRNTKTGDTGAAEIRRFKAFNEWDAPAIPNYDSGQYSFPAVFASEVSALVQLNMEIKA